MQNTAGPKKAKGSKKGRKIGRSLNECRRYRANRTREKNKAARIAKHLYAHPNDARAESDLERVRLLT